jgi:hypothetical protein
MIAQGDMILVSRAIVSPDGATTTKNVKFVSHEAILTKTHFVKPGNVVRTTFKSSRARGRAYEQLLWVVEIVVPTKSTSKSSSSGALINGPAMRVVRVREAHEIFDRAQMQRLALEADDLVIGDAEFYVAIGMITNAETVPAVIEKRDPLGLRAFLACHIADADTHLRVSTSIDDEDVTMLTSGHWAELLVDRDEAPFNTCQHVLPPSSEGGAKDDDEDEDSSSSSSSGIEIVAIVPARKKRPLAPTVGQDTRLKARCH